MSAGWIKIIGIGPGDDALITHQVQEIIHEATDVIGYIPYVERLSHYEHLTLHASDNRVEIDRSRHGFELALAGKKVLIVSSGDPGVFAMASAVFEAMEKGPKAWRAVEVEVLPGITAMLAASARIGAPLGHDFCAINLSDNLKPWAILENRLRMAVRGDFAMAFYNPRSKSRPHQFQKAMEIIKDEAHSDLLIMLARNISRPDERIIITSLNDIDENLVDMRTLVIIGNQSTHQISGTSWVYTPREVE